MPCSVSMVPYKQLQSQVPVVSKGKITSVTYLNDIDTKGERLTTASGMTISDNNKLIFCDINTSKIYFVNENHCFQSSISLRHSPWDIAAIPGTTIAVMSCRCRAYLQFIDINMQKNMKMVKVNQSESCGVDATKDNIYVGCKGKIHVLDLRGNFERTISVKKADLYIDYIAVCSNGNICYSTINEVYCITAEGNPVFSYTSPDLVQSRDIQIDDEDNIYVLGRDPRTIDIFTSSGILVDILSTDNLSEPLSFSILLNMAAQYCEPCTARGKTPSAFQWCTECEEALCSECTEAHKVQKMSRSHHLVEIGKIPNKIDLSYNCSKHQHLLFDYFCVDHDVICCKECLPKDHRACKNISSIDIASKRFKKSQSFLDFEEQLHFILETLEKMKKNRKENSSRLELEETKIRKEIAKAKENFIKRLESLEKSLLKQLTELNNKDMTVIKHHEKDIGELVKLTKAQKEALEFVRDHCSEKQAFVSIHSSKPILDDIENKVKQLTESFVDTSLKFIEKHSKEYLTDIGSIELKETPSSVSTVPYKQRQSQVPIVLKQSITSLTYLYDIDMKGEELNVVTGITISDNNTLIICDAGTKKVYFCDKNDAYLSSINSPHQPWDITAIPGTTTAVMSCKSIPYIQLIDIDRQQILKQVEVKQGECYGVAATKENIYIGSKGKIYVLDLCGHFVRTIQLKNVDHYVNYISVCSNGNICYSYNNEVQCITSDGKPVFSYSSPDLRDARDIQIDDAGNIYVIGRNSQSIHKLTCSGTLLDILLNDNLSKPFAFCFSKDLAKCYIANDGGSKVSVFKTE
ncbi:unnamed protein product [Mytilus edulis]|uniref:B box-type domain-containing protein n=1 Tax=Mytilus edulis TaxID=6550 RepID=A0A8S3SL25_MYTED|nr:unnamed protein product [Mytilus edulis]